MTEFNGYGVIWDVDGTLIDTAKLHFDAWLALGQELDKPFTQENFTATFGRRNPEIIREIFGGHYTEADLADLGFRKEEYYRAAARQEGLVLLPGVEALLNGLHELNFKQAIGSSAPRQNLDLLFELLGLDHFFEAVVSMEDTQRGKPDPQVFKVAAQKLALPVQNCLVFEDAVAGVQAAKAAGMKCIAVTFVGHHPEAALQAAGADRIVRTLEEVSVALVQHLLD